MDIQIISVGKIKDIDIKNKTIDYVNRISYDARIELTEIKDSDIETEGEKLLKILEKEIGYAFALSEEGKQYTSIKFAKKLREKEFGKIIFVIGGPFGLSKKVKKKANETLSLSKMTFPHEMAKLFLVEQIYRAISILQNKKYHK